VSSDREHPPSPMNSYVARTSRVTTLRLEFFRFDALFDDVS
jgi:hypothetical protein